MILPQTFCSQHQSQQIHKSQDQLNSQVLNQQNSSKKTKKIGKQTKFNKDRRQTKRLVNQLKNIIKQQKNTQQNQAAVKASYELNKIITACEASLNRANKNKRTKKNSYERYCQKIINNKFLSPFINYLKKSDSKQIQQVLNKQFWEKYSSSTENQEKYQYPEFSNDKLICEIQIMNYQKQQRQDNLLLEDLLPQKIMINGVQQGLCLNYYSNSKENCQQNSNNYRQNQDNQQKTNQLSEMIQECLNDQFERLSLQQDKMKDITQEKDNYLNNKKCPSLVGSDVSKSSHLLSDQDQNSKLMYNVVGTVIDKIRLTRTYSNRSI